MGPPAESATSVPRPMLGVGLVLAAMLAFAVMDGFAKILSQSLPVAQIMWVRNLVFTAVALAILRYQGGDLKTLARSARPGFQFVRALLLVLRKCRLHDGVQVDAIGRRPRRCSRVTIARSRILSAAAR